MAELQGDESTTTTAWAHIIKLNFYIEHFRKKQESKRKLTAIYSDSFTVAGTNWRLSFEAKAPSTSSSLNPQSDQFAAFKIHKLNKVDLEIYVDLSNI